MKRDTYTELPLSAYILYGRGVPPSSLVKFLSLRGLMEISIHSATTKRTTITELLRLLCYGRGVYLLYFLMLITTLHHMVLTLVGIRMKLIIYTELPTATLVVEEFQPWW